MMDVVLYSNLLLPFITNLFV